MNATLPGDLEKLARKQAAARGFADEAEDLSGELQRMQVDCDLVDVLLASQGEDVLRAVDGGMRQSASDDALPLIETPEKIEAELNRTRTTRRDET